MKKIIASALLVTALGINAANAASIPDFHSWNKPLSPNMASREEMLAYRADVTKYIAETDALIAQIRAKQKAVIAAYNQAAASYNAEDFFHKDKVPTFKRDNGRKTIKGTQILVILDEDGDDK